MEIFKVEVLGKEVSRKQFVQILAGSALTLFGLNNFISMFTFMTNKSHSTKEASHGFGSSKFGV